MLVAAAAAIFIPIGLLEALNEELQEPLVEAEAIDTIAIVELIGAALAFTAGALLGDVLYAGVVAAVVIAEREHHPRPLRELLAGLPIGRLIVVDLLLGLVVLIGFVALIVPGLVVLTWFALVAPVVKVEHPTIRAAFRRSRELVRGHFWLVFSLVVPIVVGAEIAAELAKSGVNSLLGESFASHWAGGALTELITAPIFALAVVVLYFELRESSSAQTARR